MIGQNDIGVIVVTRFAVQLRLQLPGREWIESRFDLMKRCALPSLVGQRADGFAWVLLVDAQLFKVCAPLLRGLSLPNGEVVVTALEGSEPDDDGRKIGCPREESLRQIHPGKDRFLTFRLDSDDAWHRDAIADGLVAVGALPDQPLLINFESGFVFDRATGDCYADVCRSFQGPYLAVTNEGRSRMLNFGGHHGGARFGRRVITQQRPRWLQVIHGGNLINGVPKHGRKVVLSADRLAEFGVRRCDLVPNSR